MLAQQTVYCPNCDAENSLSPFTYNREIEYAGHKIVVAGLEACLCRVCGGDPVLEDQARRNHARYVDAKRHADGLLTGEQIAAIRRNLGLTQSDAAVLFGGGRNAFSKYERGEVTQSVAMDRLMRLVSELPEAEAWLRAQAGLPARSFETYGYAAGHDGKVIDLVPYRYRSLTSDRPAGPYERQA